MREKVLEVLNSALPQIDFESSNHLVDDKILDSLAIVTLVQELSDAFGVKFSVKDLSPENLNSIDAITATIQRLKNK